MLLDNIKQDIIKGRKEVIRKEVTVTRKGKEFKRVDYYIKDLIDDSEYRVNKKHITKAD